MAHYNRYASDRNTYSGVDRVTPHPVQPSLF
jgi:hypothetical protein